MIKRHKIKLKDRKLEGRKLVDKTDGFTAGKAHWSFWLIGVIMLIWNVMGALNFFGQMTPDIAALYPESERAIFENRPLWATLGFAIAVFGGTLGCILLLLRRKVAIYMFYISGLGVIVAITHALTLDNGFSIGEITGLVILPIVVAGLLIYYSYIAARKGWIR